MVGDVGFCFEENQILQSISHGPRRGGRVRRAPALLAHSRGIGSATTLGATVGEARSQR